MNWWKKHTKFASDKIAEMISKDPSKFLISRKEILQLVRDFNAMKAKIAMMGQCIEAYDKLLNMSDDDRKSNISTMQQIRQMLDN